MHCNVMYEILYVLFNLLHSYPSSTQSDTFVDNKAAFDGGKMQEGYAIKQLST